jgi:hypothetical protein
MPLLNLLLLSICHDNYYRPALKVAWAVRAEGSHTWVTHGWKQIEYTQCADLPLDLQMRSESVTRGEIRLYAYEATLGLGDAFGRVPVWADHNFEIDRALGVSYSWSQNELPLCAKFLDDFEIEFAENEERCLAMHAPLNRYVPFGPPRPFRADSPQKISVKSLDEAPAPSEN